MKKYVRCAIRRSNHSGEMYDKNNRPIGFGYQGKSFQLREGAEVCLEKDAIYCFTDAVIEHEENEKDPVTHVTRVRKIRIPRFTIDYYGYYVCDNACGGDYIKCNGREISREEFWADDTTIITKAEVEKDIAPEPLNRANKEPDDEINDNNESLEDILL